MKTCTKHTLSLLLTVALLFFALSFSAYATDEEAAEKNEEAPAGVMMTITGRINSDFQIVSGDGVYQMEIDGESSELLEKVGRRVTVTGYVTVEEVEEEEEEEGEGEEEEEEEEEEEGEGEGEEAEVGEEGVGTITVLSYKVLAE